MDQKRMHQQAQVLRNKRMATPQRRATPVRQQGFLQMSRPIPRKPRSVYAGPPSPSELRKARAAKILEQRKQLEAEKQKQAQQFETLSNPPVAPPAAPTTPPRRGCGGCRRKR